MTTTINGLHSCKPGNDPVVGQVQLFVIEHRTGKNNKPYIKIKRANEENGGSPHRILSAEPTGYTDKFGNISFNIEVEASSSQPSAFQQTKAAMTNHEVDTTYDRIDATKTAPQSPPHAQQGEDGVMRARKHLCQVANLYALCVRCANSPMIADEIPEAHKTNDQFQSTLSSIWIEASGRRSTNGADWWSYIDLMPDKPLPVNVGKHATTVKPIQKTTAEDMEVPF